MVTKARIVVVEDEPAIRRGVSDALRITGYDVAEAADGHSGLIAASQPHVDLVLLDILLPRRDGLDVLCDLRKTYPARPVILLTARGTEEDRVRGLKLGADDYVVKPFSARELLARVEAILRRAGPKPPPGVRKGGVAYGVRPSSARELWARVEAPPGRAARTPPPDARRVGFGGGMIALPRREVRWPGGNRMELSETETALLQYLVNHRQRAVTRE